MVLERHNVIKHPRIGRMSTGRAAGRETRLACKVAVLCRRCIAAVGPKACRLGVGRAGRYTDIKREPYIDGDYDHG